MVNRESEVFDAVWPDGMPAGERVVYEAVPEEDRPLVLVRLQAAWRAANGEAWEPLARELRLKRSAFYDLRRGWLDNGLSGVIPYDRRGGRRLKAEPDDPLRAIARDLLRSGVTGVRNVDVAKKLLASTAVVAGNAGYNERLGALQRIERLVRDERRTMARDPEYLRAAYGRRLILDLSAVNVVLELPRRTLAVAAFVIDEASGAVLGSGLGTLDGALATQRTAIRSALAFVERRRADRDLTGRGTDLVLAAAPGAPVGEVGATMLRSSASDLTVLHEASHAYGRNIVQTIGPRMGNLVIAPRSTLTVDAEHYAETRKVEELSPTMALAVWEREVARHNAPVIAALAEAGLVEGDGPAHGTIAETLEAAARYLGSGDGADQEGPA